MGKREGHPLHLGEPFESSLNLLGGREWEVRAMGPETKGGEEKGSLGWGGKEPGGGKGAREGAFAEGGERRELMSTGAIREGWEGS